MKNTKENKDYTHDKLEIYDIIENDIQEEYLKNLQKTLKKEHKYEISRREDSISAS